MHDSTGDLAYRIFHFISAFLNHTHPLKNTGCKNQMTQVRNDSVSKTRLGKSRNIAAASQVSVVATSSMVEQSEFARDWTVQ